MAQGYVLNSSGAKITLTDENVTVKTDTGTQKRQNLYVKMPDGSTQDILYHAPKVPPVGWTANGTVDAITVPYVGTGQGAWTRPRALITAAGYDLAATVASGRKFRLSFYRDGVNEAFWFSIRCFANGAYAGDRPSVTSYIWFSYELDRSLLNSQFSLAWTDAPVGGGGTGRQVQIGWTYTIEFL